MCRRAGTIVVGSDHDLDFTVSHYSCLDSSVRRAFGVSQKECEWRVQCRDAEPLDIQLNVDKSVAGKIQVRIACNGRVIFPKGYGPEDSKAMLFEDFKHTWPFRGIARGIGAPHFVQMKIWQAGLEVWLPGTIMRQRPDGMFEVLVTKEDPYSGALRQEFYPSVKKQELREMATKASFHAPERTLDLMVPADDPLQGATLVIDGGEQIMRYFGRSTPPRKQSKGDAEENGRVEEFLFMVSKDRTNVVGSVGPIQLLNFMSGEARADSVTPKKPGLLVGYGSKRWVIQVGEAEHTIEIERRWKACQVVTLTVDGETLVEALAEDIGFIPGRWQVRFRLIGEPMITFEVYETDADGWPLNTTGRVLQKRTFTRICEVTIDDLSDLSSAQLLVDGVDFKALPPKEEARLEENLVMTPEAMRDQYGIMVPYKLNPTASATKFKNPLGCSAAGGGGVLDGVFGLRKLCCDSTPQETEDEYDQASSRMKAQGSMAVQRGD